ncbi:MerR family transcriptional regulator [Paenibacillus sp. CMAA1364]
MNNSYVSGRYFIQQVADVTGLSKQVIRKWEERYDLIQPERLDNGYRMYSEKDVNTLLRVKALSDKGHPVSQAVILVKEKDDPNEELFQEDNPMTDFKEMNSYVFQLLEKGSLCDEIEINLILQRAYNVFGLTLFLTSVVIPFLKEVGNRWERKDWDEYQESFSSMIVRDFLVQIRRNYPCREDAPLVLGACLPNEQHELPLHILLLQFMMRGWRTLLVGTSPAPKSIEALVQKLKPAKVVLSATTTIPFENNPDLLQELDQFAANHKKIDFYLGGCGAMKYTANKKLHSLHISNSIEDIL